MRRNPAGRRGALLIAVCLGVFLLAAGAGFTLDVGRMLLVQKELKVRVDAAALAAALEIDGTPEGITRARAAASLDADPERIEFAPEPLPDGPGAGVPTVRAPAVWEENPRDAAAVRMVRVTSGVPVPLTLVRTVVNRKAAHVRVQSAARASSAQGPVELIR